MKQIMRLALVASLLSLMSMTNRLAAQANPPMPTPTPTPSSSTGSPTNTQLMETLKLNALVFYVKAAIIGGDGVQWSADQTRITVHGLSVTIKLESTDILILAELTPYRQSPDTIFLVIKNETWLRSVESSSVQRYATVKSALVKLNTPVFFYPIGKDTSDGRSIIKMDINVSPYQDPKE